MRPWLLRIQQTGPKCAGAAIARALMDDRKITARLISGGDVINGSYFAGALMEEKRKKQKGATL